jgi:phenylacetate-CoA ligase
VLTEDTRDSVRTVWRTEVLDVWGASEGAFALPCNAGTAKHWPDDLVIIEPADEDGNPVPAGAPAAKILVTSLYKLTQPLIRYEITDEMTLLDEPCPCGCAHRRIANLTGRRDDLFRYDDGTVVHPLVFRSPLGRDRRVIEYQVRQTPRGAAITVRTEGEAALESLRHQLTGDLARAGLADPEVTITQVDSIDRLHSGKLRRFIPIGHPDYSAQP